MRRAPVLGAWMAPTRNSTKAPHGLLSGMVVDFEPRQGTVTLARRTRQGELIESEHPFADLVGLDDDTRPEAVE